MEQQLQRNWHNLPVSQVERLLDTNLDAGLSSNEAQDRTERYGPNEFESGQTSSAWKILLSQFNDFMIWVLIVAALISGLVLGEVLDAGAIMTILILNAVLGFIQEFRAERALEALKKLAAPTAIVIRDGHEQPVSARNLVPGDVIHLEAGDSVPADGRVARSQTLSTQEATLTGESQPIAKSAEPMRNRDIALADRNNMTYAGTLVASGRALVLVTATGSFSEMGKIAALLKMEEEKTPLQHELRTVGKRITVLCLAIAATVILAGIARGFSLPVMFLAGVSLAVAAIPEGLPAVITVSLALGVQNMARKHAVIRRLHAVETLGSTSIICSDKTGTLTQNQMAARRIYLQNNLWRLTAENKLVDQGSGQQADLDLSTLLTIAVLCNDARKTSNGKTLGDPTEAALIALGEAFDVSKANLAAKTPRIHEVPFDSERKRMSTIHQSDGSYLVLMKGAPEQVLPLCSKLFVASERALTQKDREAILQTDGQLAKEGFRNLAFAYKELPQMPAEINSTTIEHDLVFVGLVGLSDPPRPEVPEAIRVCKDAHINVVMITGDHKLTAAAIAEEIGLLGGRRIVTGQELQAMSLPELEQQLPDIGVFARVSPQDKIKIVEAFKEKDYIVAMTGDGINDAPAVKMADIGISMGLVGTDVTREASDLVLTDDNFATIVEAVRQGRIIFDNIKKFILFLLSCNISEVGTVFLAMMLGFPLPLFPVQILWINLVTDGLPALALGVDPADPRIMERPPRPREEGILSPTRQKQILWQGLLLTSGALASFLISYAWLNQSLRTAQTVTFTTLVFIQLLHSLNFRSAHRSVFARSSFANKYLLIAILGSLALHFTALYLPLVRPIFRTVPLGSSEWLIVAGSCVLPLLALDQIKRVLAHKPS